jgi:uncharacterized protein (TIGR02246 family)
MTSHRAVSGGLALVFALHACRTTPQAGTDAETGGRAAVLSALERYMVAARAVDPEGIAAAFAPTGVLFEPGIFPIVSRDSLRLFVASFPGVQVESAAVVPDTIQLFGGTAYLWGSYYERLVFPGQPRSEQRGRLVIEWTRQGDGTWLIQRYFRVPEPAPGPPQERGD